MTIHELIQKLQAAAKQHGEDMQCVISTREMDEVARYRYELPEISYVTDATAGDYVRIHCGPAA